VDVTILLSDVISIETLLSFQITTAGDRDKHVLIYRLCKYHFKKNLSIGSCDFRAEQKILFMNETKWYEIWPRLKG
jgi:hypothetical protein